MSQLKPTILINPTYSTNQLDTSQAGWYQVQPNTSNLALRVSNTMLGTTGLSGEIRLNTTAIPPVFQGNNGSAWVDFNSTQGPIGPPGLDFTNIVNFNNLGSNIVVGTVVNLASVFATTFIDASLSISNVNIRSLEGSEHVINSNLTVDSLILRQNSNIITIEPQPIPYNWNFTSSNNTVSYLKNSSSDATFYGWGDNSNWIVQQGATVLKGQAVRLTKDSALSSNIVITPIKYTTLVGVTPFNTPFNFLGIASNDASGGGTCSVCTKGVTTVLCTSNIASGFSTSSQVPFVGAYGIVGKDAGIFCAIQDPTVDYIKAGYFLEDGVGLATNGNYALFYVDRS